MYVYKRKKFMKRGLIISHLFVSYTKLLRRQPVLRPLADERLMYTYWIKVMKVETTNFTSLPLCLVMNGIRAWEIAVQFYTHNIWRIFIDMVWHKASIQNCSRMTMIYWMTYFVVIWLTIYIYICRKR